MKARIVSRWSRSKVLFECEVPDGVESGLAMRHALEKAVEARANLADANLAGASLAGASLAGAYLADANLAGAKWRDGIVLKRAPLYIHGLYWAVVILDDHMQVGCELHSLAEWREFDDARIVEMDGKSALRFWRAHKSALLALAESDGRGVTVTEQAAA